VNTGDNAIDFTLQSVAEEKIQLSTLNNNNPLVLIVLRGWPEYQCPVCSRQVGQFIDMADKFQKLGANVLMIYPGPSNVLKEKAQEFTEDFTFPDNFHFALDPDYSMVNKYGLRWNAPRETAYPSTFVIDKTGKIVYSKISTTHGGRAAVNEVLEALGKL
jgi:peroxiredoxin